MGADRPVIGADVAAGADAGLTAGCDLGSFYDEMFESAEHLEERIRVADALFRNDGIGFTVYGDSASHAWVDVRCSDEGSVSLDPTRDREQT